MADIPRLPSRPTRAKSSGSISRRESIVNLENTQPVSVVAKIVSDTTSGVELRPPVLNFEQDSRISAQRYEQEAKELFSPLKERNPAETVDLLHDFLTRREGHLSALENPLVERSLSRLRIFRDEFAYFETLKRSLKL